MKRTRNVSVLLSTTMVQYMKTQQGQWRRRDASLSFFHFRMRRARCCVCVQSLAPAQPRKSRQTLMAFF